MEERTSSGIGTKIIAGLVLAIGAWLLLKIVVSIAMGIATTVAVIVLVVALIWAFTRF